jgi:protein required for attachment to host cells
MKPIRTWIVIADGARARIVCNEGPGKGLAPVPASQMSVALPRTRDLGSDRPGRVYDSQGYGRHGIEPRVDWHRFEKQHFAKKVATMLDASAATSAFDRLILVAPAKTLGDLRAALGKTAQNMVVGEIVKDLTACADRDLAGHLKDVISL